MDYTDETAYDSMVYVISEMIKEYLKTSTAYIKENNSSYGGEEKNGEY